QAAIGVVGDVPQVVMELGDVGAGHLSHAVIAEPGNNEPLQHPFVALGRAWLEAKIDVLLLKPLGEFLDCNGSPIGVRLAAGSSPFLVAAMIVIARLRACSQGRTVLGPRLMRRDRRPARYCIMYRLRPLGRTRRPKPGRSSSQRKYSPAPGSRRRRRCAW